MISLIDKNNKLNEHKNSLIITYPRTVSIIMGHYPYPEIIHNIIIEIKNNLDSTMKNYTNVQGGMTDWNYFKDKKIFNDFLTFIINKHQTTHPDIFKYFFQRTIVENAWGNEIRPGDYLQYHEHNCPHGILYLTDGCDLMLPELNIKITPKAGDYYIFPPCISHGFDPHQGDKNRYSMIFNLGEHEKKFDTVRKLESLYEK